MEKKWQDRFMMMAVQVAGWSKLSSKVGAVAVNGERKVAGVGYNGGTARYNDESLTEETTTFLVIHAELNALQNSNGSGLTLFVTSQPCLACAAAIVASQRVLRVVMPSTGSVGRWQDSQREAIAHLKHYGIEVSYSG